MHAEDAELAEFRHDLTGQRACLEPVSDVRQHPVRGEGAHRVADKALLIGQLVIDLQQVRVRGTCGHGRFLSLAFQIRVLTSQMAMSARPRSGHYRAMNEPSSHGTKRLYRLREGRVVAGVCAGLAAYFGVDPTLVRLAFALLTVFGGAGVLLYLCAWVVMPEEGEGASIAETLVNKRRS